MKATQAQTARLLVKENGMRVTALRDYVKDGRINNINLTDRCVHIFFKDGSNLFIRAEPFNTLVFEAKGGLS